MDNLISEKYIIFTGKIIKRHVLTLSVDNIATDLISNYKNSNYEKDFYHTIGAGFCCTLFAEDFLAKESRLRDTGFSFRIGGYDRRPVFSFGVMFQTSW